MKKLYLSLLINSTLLTLCYMQQTHGMEQQITLQKFNDELSEKLYNPNITVPEIQELVAQGADVNYESPTKWPIPIHYAKETTNQGLENMKAIVSLGARLDSAWQRRTSGGPLFFASYSNNTEMVLLLLDYETNETFFSAKGHYTTNSDMTVNAAVYHKQLAVIKKLIAKKFMTPNKGIERYCYYWNRASLDILTYLIEQNPTNLNKELDNLILNKIDLCYEQISTKKPIFALLCKKGAQSQQIIDSLKKLSNECNAMIQILENQK